MGKGCCRTSGDNEIGFRTASTAEHPDFAVNCHPATEAWQRSDYLGR
jgi:hypothetical protein